MKHYELKATTEHLKKFNQIRYARRVDDNIIELSFDKNSSFFFNMTRGNSFIYIAKPKRPPKSYNAPFDVLLHSMVSMSKIIDIDMPNNDRVVRFLLFPRSSYKNRRVILQFEFTGRHTNVILLNDDEVVVEALRHINSDSSFRVIKPTVKLLPIPPINRDRDKDRKIENIELHLKQKYIDFEIRKIRQIRKQKLLAVQKKQKRLRRLLERLPNSEELVRKEKKYKNYANIVLANLYKIKHYDTELKTYDFEGNRITIKLPEGIVPNRISEYFFNRAKKYRKKAQNVHLERENLISKLSFYENMYYALENAESTNELELLLPKRARVKRKKEKIKECELFWIEDYKILIGRNSKENQALLKIAKSNDLWMHIRDIPSSHLIIKTDKQNLPYSVIEKASKLCVDFSINKEGDYIVDYCKRRFVKIQEGSNVQYDKYKSIKVRKNRVSESLDDIKEEI